MSVTTQLLESPAMRAVIRERDEALAELERGGRPGATFIVPCYEQVAYLPACLDSIAAQTVAPLEVIVIDDGSPNEGAAIREVAERYGARYVRVTNRGLASARNTGLMLARGEWIVALDSDDWIDPTFVEATLAVAESSGADVVQVGIQEHGERSGAYRPGFDMPLEMVTDGHLLTTNRFYYCCLMRTKVLREIGGWNARMSHLGGWEDWDAHRDLLRRGVKYAEAPGFLFHYLCKPGSMATIAEQNRAALVAEMKRHHT